jgi:uncharacterized protein involved in exopolysaccharide biosynthesis
MSKDYGSYEDLKLAATALWQGRVMIGAITLAGTLVAGAYALLATEIYRAEALVQPREEARGGNGIAGLALQLGGLADLTGLSLGQTGDRAVALATLRSRALIEAFIREKNLLPKLYESKWDAAAGKWKTTPEATPTVWEAYRLFMRKVLKVSEDKKTGLVTVAIEWDDPEESSQWVTELIERTNAHLKRKAVEEGEKNLVYLDQQSRSIGQVELRQAVYGLVETELKKLMIAKGGDEFALRTIDPAVVPKKRIWPRRGLVLASGLLVSFFIGSLAALVLNGARKGKAA